MSERKSSLDIIPKGMLGELIFSEIFGVKPLTADEGELADVKSHINNAFSHTAGVGKAGDPVNALAQLTDANVNLLLAFAVASRISNTELRREAFSVIESYLQQNGLGQINSFF